jgi:hypothetical protein
MLQIHNYEEHGTFDPTADIEHLVEGPSGTAYPRKKGIFALGVVHGQFYRTSGGHQIIGSFCPKHRKFA